MSVTIILADEYLPWLAASDDDTRPVLTGVWFDPCLAAVATDTHIMAVCPFSLQGDGTDAEGQPFAGALVPASFLRDAYRQRGKLSALILTLDGETVSALGKHGRMEARLIEDTFPNWKRVVPSLIDTAPFPIPLVNVNPSLYVRLRDALGLKAESSVPLAAPGGEARPFLMPGLDGAFGVLMPIFPEKAQADYGTRMNLAAAQWLAYQGKGTEVKEETPVKPVAEKPEKPRKARPAPVVEPVPVAEPAPVPVAEEVPIPVPVPVPVPAAAPTPSRLPAWLAGVV